MLATVKVPLYPATLTPLITTSLPTTRPTGFETLVIVTVVPLSVAVVIGFAAPTGVYWNVVLEGMAVTAKVPM